MLVATGKPEADGIAAIVQHALQKGHFPVNDAAVACVIRLTDVDEQCATKKCFRQVANVGGPGVIIPIRDGEIYIVVVVRDPGIVDQTRGAASSGCQIVVGCGIFKSLPECCSIGLRRLCTLYCRR